MDGSIGKGFMTLLVELRGMDSMTLADCLRAELQYIRLRRALKEIVLASETLGKLAVDLDPVKLPSHAFAMRDSRTTGEMIGKVVEGTEGAALAENPEFYGSGVYAIYYRGTFPAYRAITETTCPIYVWKAGPENSQARNPREQGIRLYARLREHR